MKKQELIDALRQLAMGRMDSIEAIADHLMPEPTAAEPAPVKPALKAK